MIDTRSHISVSHEIREFLKTIIDHGTSIDSGGNWSSSDLWATIGGVEYLITVTISKPKGEGND